jgi:8-oxo-dGTP pyrophosphatase MutT (NUDIX family)
VKYIMVAASILPITIHKNQLLFLFGKENELEDSAKGWSDFGGRVDPGETIFQGALREGSEELTGFLGNNKNLRDLIRSNGGVHKIVHNGYHIHLFYLPYDENLPKYYNYNHTFLWERIDKQYLNKTKFFEKIEIKWFSINEVKSEKSEFRNFYQEILDIFVDNEKLLKTFVHSKKQSKKQTMKNKS